MIDSQLKQLYRAALEIAVGFEGVSKLPSDEQADALREACMALSEMQKATRGTLRLVSEPQEGLARALLEISSLKERLRELQITWPAGLLDRKVRADEIDEDPAETGRAAEAEIIRLRQANAELERHLENERQAHIFTMDHAVPDDDVAAEREAARNMARAGVDLMMLYLGGAPVSADGIATMFNDLLHDWIAVTPDDDARRSLCEFIEKARLPSSSATLPKAPLVAELANGRG